MLHGGKLIKASTIRAEIYAHEIYAILLRIMTSQNEKNRHRNMTKIKTKIPKNYFEKKAWENNLLVCGIDEVGRGCLAGPVVVGAVILPPNTNNPLLKDSKLMDASERAKAYKWITKHCYWSTAFASHEIVDARNIYQATLFAMHKAYLQLIHTVPFSIQKLKYVVIDAMPFQLDEAYGHKDLEFYHFNFGEKQSNSIAAGSIVAKVTRDRLMEEINASFPQFDFKQHKGYATKMHRDVLCEQGPSIIHRTTFIENLDKKPNTIQQKLFE